MGASHRRSGRSFLRRPARPPVLSRRDFLRRSSWISLGLAGSGLLSACGTSAPTAAGSSPTPPAPAGSLAFLHGVASGDPLTDRVILWTRITPDASAASVTVDWLIASDPELKRVVGQGRFITSSARDFTVKVDATGLESYTPYYYQFSAVQADGSTVRSPIGRTRTAPKAGDTDRLRFVSASCANYSYGYFNGYAAAALRKDVDAMLFLGDYIYETGGDATEFRTFSPAHEILTLADYRQRHAQYKTDPDLQAAHRQMPWICVWDDHETTDNSYSTGANNHTEGAEGIWKNREGWAVRAYFEWMPIRDNADTTFDSPNGEGLLPEGHGSIQRRLQYGDLVDLIMLDTRLAGRVMQTDTTTVTAEHTILGSAQRDWFLAQLRNSRAQWKIIGQQVTFAPLKIVPLPEANGGTYLNSDAWDGYRFDRNAVLDTIQREAIDNVVFLSGDIHAVIALDVPVEPNDPAQYNPVTGDGSLAVEFCNGAIANIGVINEALMATNPHLKYANVEERGYLLLDITAERVQGEYWYTGLAQVRSPLETFQRALSTSDKANRLAIALTASAERADAPALAP